MSALYTIEILRLAAALGDQPRLADASASVEKRAALCGSRVTVDVELAGGAVRAFGQEVRACALGQAAAALLGQAIVGRSPDEIAAARDILREYLSGARDDPGNWPGLDALAAARPFPARHAAMLLPFEAAAEAVGQ